jgi:hypothetical protein
MSQDFRTVRFRNHELDDDPRGVADRIHRVLDGVASVEWLPRSPSLSTRESEPEGLTRRGDERE